jgi:hypothetical protein
LILSSFESCGDENGCKGTTFLAHTRTFYRLFFEYFDVNDGKRKTIKTPQRVSEAYGHQQQGEHRE